MIRFGRFNQLSDVFTMFCLRSRDFIKEIKKNYHILFLCFFGTFVWGLLTHSYIFLNGSFSHDSLAAFLEDNSWKIQLGRIFVPAFRAIFRGYITLPWLIGIVSLICISLAVLFTVKILEIHSKILIFLVSGIFVTNVTVISSAATYINSFDSDMWALFFSAFCVYLWKKYDKGFLYGSIPLCLSLGLYQAYLSVATTLIIFYLVMQLLNGEKFGIVFKKGIKSIGMILIAGILYFISMQFILYITHETLASGSYNSIDTVFSMSVKNVIFTAVKGYFETIHQLLSVVSIYSEKMVFAVHVIILAIAGLIILFRISGKEIKVKEKILALVLILLLPFSMNITYALTGGMTHDLMHYALWLSYLLVLLISWSAVDWCKSWKPVFRFGNQIISACLVFIILWGNVQLGNSVYLRKDLEQQGTLSLFTRIVYQLENFDGYVTGKTPVVFVGKPSTVLEPIRGFERTYELVGSNNWYVLGAAANNYYQSYFDFILQNPAVMADKKTWSQMQEDNRVSDMPCYPEKGSIKILDGTVVIKLGENNDS